MSDLKLSIKLTTEGGQIVVRDINGVKQAADSATAGLNETGNAGERAGKQLAVAGSGGVSGLTQHMNMLRSSLGLLVGGFSAINMIDKADDWGQMASRVRQAKLTVDEYNYVQERMVESARETFRALSETREGFIRMSPILRDMNYALSESIDIVDSFSALLVTNSAAADRAAFAQAALSKSIQNNRVDSESWQTIFGVMPSILDNITASTGKTASEIRELGISGKLSITDLTDALLDNREKNLDAVRDMPTSVRDALGNFNNVWQEWLGRQNEAKGVTAGMADAIVSMTEHFDLLAAVVGGAVVGGITAYTAKQVIMHKQTIAGYIAKRIATAEEVRLAQAQVAQTQAAVAQINSNNMLAGSHARATAAVTAHKASVDRLAAAQAAQVTIGRSLLGVLGGPAGIALTAGLVATSFFAMRSGADQAAEGSSNLFTVTERLRTELEKMTAAQAKKYLQDMSEEYKKAQFDVKTYSVQVEDLNKRLAEFPNGARVEEWRKSLTDAEGNLDTARQKLEDYNEQQRILNEHIEKQANGSKGRGGNASENKELEKSLLDLYNAHLLNANAIDAHGRALTGIDFDLFKAQFKAAEKAPENLAASLKNLYEQKQRADANLSADQFLAQVREEIRLTEVKLTLGQAEFELQKQLAGFAHADTSRLAAIREEVALLQQKDALANGDKILADLQQETALLQIRLEKGQEEYEVQKKLFLLKGGDPAHIAAIESQVRAQQALNEQIVQTEAVSSGAFTDMLDSMTALGSAGDAVGDVLIQTFGRVAQQITAMTTAQDSYRKNLEKLQKEREKASKMDSTSEAYKEKMVKIQQTENRLQRENFQNQMGQYSALSGTMSQFFGEQSREREALHKMEMAFSAVEMAMALQKAAQNALVAITSQGEGDPYTAFARIAAMAALMAGLGVFSGSASGSAPTAAERQETQGTGSILGDSTAKSNSINNAFERIEELELDQYNELRAINTSIKALNAGIAKLAINLVSSYGKFDESAYTGELGKISNKSTGGWLGKNRSRVSEFEGLSEIVGGVVNDIVSSFNTTKKKLTDSGISFDAQSIGEILANGIVDASYYSVVETTKKKAWGLIKNKSSSTEYTDLDNALLEEFGRVFTHIGTSVNSAVEVLGFDLERELENYVINLPHLSLKDLSGDEIEKELNAVFSNQSDLMVQWLVPAMSQYQQMGEGLYETLIRVAQEQAIVNAQFDALGLQLSSLGDVTAETRIAVSQSLVELMGGIEQFRDLTSEYFDGFYSDAEKFANLSGNINTAFADLGLSVPSAAMGIRDIVDGIDLTTESGQQLFATLMQLVPSLREYYDVLEQRAEFERDLQRELAAFDMTGFEQSLLQLQDWYDEQIKTAESLGAETVFIEKLYARKRAEAIDGELARINDDHARSLDTLNNQYNQLYSAIDSAGKGVGDAILNIRRQMSGWNEVSYQQNLISGLKTQIGGENSTSDQIAAIQQMQQAITARYNAELARNKQMADASQQRYQTELAAVNAIRSAALQLLTAADAMLLSNMSPELIGSQLGEAKSQFDKLTADARKGDASAMQQLQSVGSSYLDIAKEFYAQGSDEYSAIFDEIQNIYRSIGATAPPEPRAPATTIAYQSQDYYLQRSALRELEALQEKLDELQEKEKEEQALAAVALEAEQRKARDDALEAQNKHMEATLKAGENIVAAITTQTKATDAVISELRLQSSSAKSDTETLRNELARTRTELARMQDMAFGNRRVM